jgi:uncharacterized membrane protein (DUF4010 family)
MLLAWKTELSRFAGDLQPSEIRSAVLLGLIGFVIYPVLPDRYIDHWQLFNPSDAWKSVIAISGIGFVNYTLLRIYSASGLYLGAFLGGLVNSSATMAELAVRARDSGLLGFVPRLCLIATVAMFARNLILATLFSPASLIATLVPMLVMTLVAGAWLWQDHLRVDEKVPGQLALTSPISIRNVLWFSVLFIAIQIGGTLLTRLMGSTGMIMTAAIGGLVSSASTTAAAVTMASHGQISASLAGSATVIASLTSTFINIPIIWKLTRDQNTARRIALQMMTVIVTGIIAVAVDRVFQLSESLLQR